MTSNFMSTENKAFFFFNLVCFGFQPTWRSDARSWLTSLLIFCGHSSVFLFFFPFRLGQGIIFCWYNIVPFNFSQVSPNFQISHRGSVMYPLALAINPHWSIWQNITQKFFKCPNWLGCQLYVLEQLNNTLMIFNQIMLLLTIKLLKFLILLPLRSYNISFQLLHVLHLLCLWF